MSASSTGRRCYRLGFRARGFSLIEVLIAILILGFGLLALAMLQVMTMRFTQSANHRTQATNLAYEMMDQVRANRLSALSYAKSYTATVTDSDCVPTTGAATPQQFQSAWQCRLGKALGEDATASVQYSANSLTVYVYWGDEHWKESGKTSFRVSTHL